jgi:hypothetical protein
VGNIAAGYFSISETIKAISDVGNAHTHLDWAAIAIIFAIPFDALDGRIARMTNTTSDFGKELDSLADAITFGMAPSLLALIWGFHFLPDSVNPQLLEHLRQAGAFICFLFLIGGVSRLLLSGAGVVDCDSLAGSGGAERVSDGEHLAVLVGQGDQLLAQPPFPASFGAGDRVLYHFPVFPRGAFLAGAALHVLGNLGAGGVRLDAAAAAKAGEGCGRGRCPG